MAKQIVNIGSTLNSRDGDPLRTAFTKINNNFNEVYEPLNTLGVFNPTEQGDIVINAAVKGNVVSNDDVVLVDISSGKVTLDAVPEVVNLSYEFRVNFDAQGLADTVENLPEGWVGDVANSVVYITHDNIRSPKSITYWGLTAQGEYQHRYPTAGYPATRPLDTPNQLKIHINAAIAGAVDGSHAIISIVF